MRSTAAASGTLSLDHGHPRAASADRVPTARSTAVAGDLLVNNHANPVYSRATTRYFGESMAGFEGSWGKRDALKTYSVRKWGIKYFDINNQGNVTVAPHNEKGGAV